MSAAPSGKRFHVGFDCIPWIRNPLNGVPPVALNVTINRPINR